jgi:hypothetical protein
VVKNAVLATSDVTVVRGTESVRRRPLPSVLYRLLIFVCGLALVFILEVPVLALQRDDWDAATTAAAIQASTSVFGALVGGIALIAAVLAYEETQRRPNLLLGIRNSMNVISFRLENIGSVPAANPRIVLRFSTHPYVRPAEESARRRAHSVLWRLADHVSGGPWFRRVTWIPTVSSSIIHPDLTLETPGLSFPATNYAARGNTAVSASTAAQRYAVPIEITWTADRCPLKTVRVRMLFPSGRDQAYHYKWLVLLLSAVVLWPPSLPKHVVLRTAKAISKLRHHCPIDFRFASLDDLLNQCFHV